MRITQSSFMSLTFKISFTICVRGFEMNMKFFPTMYHTFVFMFYWWILALLKLMYFSFTLKAIKWADCQAPKIVNHFVGIGQNPMF